MHVSEKTDAFTLVALTPSSASSPSPSRGATRTSRREESLATAKRERHILDGGEPDGEGPLLNDIALLVNPAADAQRDAERSGVEIDDVKDAANTLAVPPSC